MRIEYHPAPAGTARATLASECVIVDGWAYICGVGPIDPTNDRTMLPELVEAQTRKTFENLDAILAAHGMSRDHVVSVRVHLVDHPRLRDRFDDAWRGAFAATRLPARSVIGVSALPRGAQINIDVIARTPPA